MADLLSNWEEGPDVTLNWREVKHLRAIIARLDDPDELEGMDELATVLVDAERTRPKPVVKQEADR